MFSASIDRYLIDPVTEFVGQVDLNDQFVTIARPSSRTGEVWSVGNFVSRNRDAVYVKCHNSEELDEIFNELQAKATALDFWMMLIDPEIRDTTKERIASELEELFSRESVYAHVQDIVYSVPLSRSVCTRFLEEYSLGKRVKSFATQLLRAQHAIRDLFAVWVGMKFEPLVKSIGHRELTGRLISKSFFRKVVTQGTTQAEVEQIAGTLAFELSEVCDPRLVSKALADYKRTLPPGEFKKLATKTVSDQYEEDEEIPSSTHRVTRLSGYELLQQAEKEVAAIASLYAEGKDTQAAQFLEELIARQSADKAELVVKSLCNIASRTSTSGRRDISLQLLRRAIERTDGLDVILYMQIGNEFRSIREFDKALGCYQKAKTLDDGSKADGIRDEIIRVSVAKGEYDLALTQYSEIVDIQQWPSTLSSLGTLHRKMGNLRNARDCYWAALDRSEGLNDVAHAGLAEVAKQSGRPHLAIEKYQAIFKNYNKALEPSSVRVYSLALSQLLMLTQQYERACSVLKQLKDCTLDHEINFLFAKIYLLSGQRSLASHHMQKAKIPDLRGIASELFQFAMSLVGTVGIQTEAKARTAIPIDDYLPEERGLVGCRNAVAAIVEQQYDVALDSLANVHFVDRIHSDFSCVLRFHANRCIDSHFDFKKDRYLCGILKRGFPTLRKTATAIVNSEFDIAVKHELEFCLHVA